FWLESLRECTVGDQASHGRHGHVVAHAGWIDSGRTRRECLGGPSSGRDSVRLAQASGVEPIADARSDDGVHCIRLVDSVVAAASRELTNLKKGSRECELRGVLG